ncbi:MAG: hypothetical protein QOF84_737, partial [Streptomyces sp.]|nr:hypothetical protein [Streptomyces sp.]
MDVDGAYESRKTNPPPAPPPMLPRPAGPPPMPQAAPPTAMETWLRTPRHRPAPGIFAYGHVPRPPRDPDRLPDRRLIGGALLSLVCALLLLSMVINGYIPLLDILGWITPDSWNDVHSVAYKVFSNVVWLLTAVLLVKVFGRAGKWPQLIRRYITPLLRSAVTDPAPHEGPAAQQLDPVEWPELRAAGQNAAADRLAAEIRAGRMGDVDYVRLRRAWGFGRVEAFTDAVLRQGAAACAHPSGARDLPVRAARHDLLTSQVRIGLALADERNPYQHQGAGLALDPTLLGTGLLAVGPPGSGKTRHLIRPVVESLSLQALSGTAAVVAVAGAGADLGPADAYDVVISLGDPGSAYDLDLYGGATDPDEAAAMLAEALLDGPETDTRRAATALSQLLGPYRAAHGRYPSVTELRELLDASPTAYAALRDALDAAGAHGQARELDARERQAERPGDIGPLLADRVALLDRPAFAGFFDVTGRTRPFSLRTLEHPLRVRIDLPERGHAEASRILARLVLAHFTAAVTGRTDRSLFACLVLDDAAHVVSAEAVRGLQRLRSANAGAVLTLRTLDDVPEALRTALLGAVGCRMVFSGITTWDGKRFAEAWGTTWVEARDVTRTPDQSGGLLRRATRGVRKLFTGEAVTTESVTVRRVERERWSASDLAHAVPAGHAVLSLTATDGEHAPPVL